MAELAGLRISRFRSIEDIRVVFPPGMPVVLFGQNNAGKSNILKAFNIGKLSVSGLHYLLASSTKSWP